MCSVGYGQHSEQLNLDLLDLQLVSEDDLTALESLLDNPIDLNRAEVTDLWFLNDSLASAVLTAGRSAPFSDWEDLTRRTGLQPEMVQFLQELAYLPPEYGVEARLSTRVTNTGADERIRTRFNIEGEEWSAQWVIQRDPGEYHLADLSDLSITIYRNSTQVNLGAHRLTWGLGQVLSEEFVTPRGESLLQPITRIAYLKPGYSISSTGVLNGVGIHHRWDRFQLFAGISLQKVDVTSDQNGTSQVVSYRIHSGPVVTAGENLGYLAGIKSLFGWEVGGLIANYQLRSTSSLSGLQRQVYSLVVKRSFQTQAGDWRLDHEEAAENTGRSLQRSSQTRINFISANGLHDDQLRLTLLYRSYPPDWVPLRGSLVGDQVSRGNETGWFLGWQWKHRPWRFSGYLDSYRQMIPQSYGYWPRDGWESGLSLRIEQQPLAAGVLYRYQVEHGTVNTYNDDGLSIIQRLMTIDHYLKLTLNRSWSSNFTTGFFAAIKVSDSAAERGFGEVLGADLNLHFRSDLALDLGVYGFTTDGWDQRIYVYEFSLPGEFNFRALSGRGVRAYGRVALPVGWGQVSIRAARQWWYTGLTTGTLNSSWQAAVQMDIPL